MKIRWLGLRLLVWAAFAGLLLLSACGGADVGSVESVEQTTEKLDFDVVVRDGIEAHVVVQAADGSVIAHEPVDAETRRVAFTDIPQDAMVTALARSVENSYYGSDGPELQTSFEASTYPASYVAGRSFYFGFYANLEVSISGQCPDGTDTVSVRSEYYRRTAYCSVDPVTLQSVFSLTWWLNSARSMQTNGAMSFILFAEVEGSQETHFALFQDVMPEEAVSGVEVGVDDWRVDFGVNRLTLSFPALSPEHYAMAYSNVNGRYKGRDIRPQYNVTQGIDSDGGGTAEFEYVPFPMDEAGAWHGLDVYENLDDGFLGSRTLAWDASVTLPLDESLTVGKELWPLPADLAWSDANAPVLSFAWSGPVPTDGYAYLASRDYAEQEQRTWRWYWPGDRLTAGELVFPSLPAALQTYVPLSTGSDDTYADVAFGDYERLDATLPSSAHEVSIGRWQTSADVSQLDQAVGPRASEQTLIPHVTINLR